MLFDIVINFDIGVNEEGLKKFIPSSFSIKYFISDENETLL